MTEFARTLITDFPIQNILDHLVKRIVEVLPVTAAGVTLIEPGKAPRYVAASDSAALRYEQLQTELAEGPCIEAYESGEAVVIPDLARDQVFPAFAKAAVALGLRAVFTFPMRHGDGRLGALDLYRSDVGSLDATDLAAAQTLADIAAAYVLNAETREVARIASDRFAHSAMHDALTGLPNRALLKERIDHAAQRARRSRAIVAVLFVDLDHFKRVNDTRGHAVGDQLLVAVAERLTHLVRPGDTLARVSGDEFVILCEDLTDVDQADALAARVVAGFDEPFSVGGRRLAVTASIGIAFTGPGETVSDELVMSADAAMYEAKRQGRARHQVLDLRKARQHGDRNRLEDAFREAFANEQLDVAYQPIVRMTDGRITGLEALLRWTQAHGAPISALTMIGIAEEDGMIDELGRWVLERACRDHALWRTQAPDVTLEIAVNVATPQLMARGFASMVSDIIASTALDPSVLMLELTESIFIDDAPRAATVLADLRSMQVKLALDDFGTGYSSLTYLNKYPVDIIKIDREFTAQIGRLTSGTKIVAAVANLAHILNLSVTVEGIETKQQRDKVQEMGCEAAQGYFYARPMPADSISAMLRDRERQPLVLPLPVG